MSKISFKRILLSLYNQYNLDYCKLADSLHLDDEIVLGWENGTISPTDEQLQMLSDAYIVPLKLLKESLNNKE